MRKEDPQNKLNVYGDKDKTNIRLFLINSCKKTFLQISKRGNHCGLSASIRNISYGA